MRNFLPLLIVMLGFTVGMLVNLIIDWLYKSREVLTRDCLSMIQENGWIKYLVTPWRFDPCEKRKTYRVLFVNIIFIIITGWLWFSPPVTIRIDWGLPLAAYFAIVVVMDMEHRVVLHEVSLIGAVMGVIFGICRHGWWSTLIGGLVGFGFMFLIYRLGYIYLRTRKKVGVEADSIEALGFGDVNISGVIGLMLGWPGIISGLVLGIFAGGLFSTVYLIYRKATKKYQQFDSVSYAPFLVLGAILVLFFREIIL